MSEPVTEPYINHFPCTQCGAVPATYYVSIRHETSPLPDTKEKFFATPVCDACREKIHPESIRNLEARLHDAEELLTQRPSLDHQIKMLMVDVYLLLTAMREGVPNAELYRSLLENYRERLGIVLRGLP